MLIINPALIGRQYYTHDPKTTYTCQGAYVKPDSGVILVGEYSANPCALTPNTISRMATCRLADATFIG
jgi:hypothetical protein